MKNSAILITFLFLAANIFAQSTKKQLTHDDILKWQRITETVISSDGKYIVYKQEPWKGDPTLKITTPEAAEIASVKCATDAQITFDSKFVVFTLKPAEDTIRQLKLKKTKKEDLPINSLAIFNLETKNTDTIEKLISVKVPEKWAGWIAWQTEEAKDTTKKAKAEAKKEDEKAYPLFVRNMKTGETNEFPAVNSYLFAEEKETLVFISEGKDSTFDAGIYFLNLTENSTQKIFDGKGKFKQLTIDKTGEKVAFLVDTLKKKDEAHYSLHCWNKTEQATKIINNENAAIPDNLEISENGRLLFSENRTRLFFGTAPKKAPKDTTILDEEIPVLDIWTWNEEELQSAQIVNKNRDSKKSYLAVYHLAIEKTVQLETQVFSGIRQIKKGDSDKLLAWSNRPYAVQSMWEGSPEHNDFYLVDVNSGEAKMIKKDIRATPQVSPEGKYLYWYNAIDTSWNTFNIETGKEFKITSPATIQCADELNDVPNFPDSYRTAGWLENDEALLVYDRFDIWKVQPENQEKPVNITQNGRQKNISYRLVKFDEEHGQSRFGGGDEKGIDSDKPLLLAGHNEISRADGYYELVMNKSTSPKELLSGNFSLNTPKKAKNSDLIVFTKEDFQTYPDLITTNLSFKKQVQISNVAPQQKEFLWGTAELVSWTSLDGRKLEGTLHKPDNFDPTKKYPMIVNFYEKSSQELFSYRMPEPHRSTIDYHYYTSNSYLVFNPDIYYKEGYPGEDAFNCVMPGVTALIGKGFVDEKHIGAQGHSWGGYQVAYLATRTNLFAAIESGAPVVNMISAYGGIRWTSGLNRSFQYEHQQSRIGKSIWELPLRYIENSPVFTLDKINTPILIMHNDDDGAVPWYQGIEFFIGLRRLQKPAWLLNYNEADHWPTKLRDKHDFQIRLAQFFNHYLKGEPMPEWMKEGIPAVEKKAP
ncbi:MAG TPA: peptidase S9 [Prolixibacteraceae bacterium]|nr:peptidase S9 [Prolixibacteraceae bacterium]